MPPARAPFVVQAMHALHQQGAFTRAAARRPSRPRCSRRSSRRAAARRARASSVRDRAAARRRARASTRARRRRDRGRRDAFGARAPARGGGGARACGRAAAVAGRGRRDRRRAERAAPPTAPRARVSAGWSRSSSADGDRGGARAAEAQPVAVRDGSTPGRARGSRASARSPRRASRGAARLPPSLSAPRGEDDSWAARWLGVAVAEVLARRSASRRGTPGDES